MTGVEFEITLDEAYDRVLAEWNVDHDELVRDCWNGHFDCSFRVGGPCMNEAVAKEFGRAREEVRDGKSAGGTKPPAGSKSAESMESTR